MGAPQIILFTIMALIIGIRLVSVIDGEMSLKSFAYTLIGDVAFIGLMVWGGFFR